MKLMVIPDLHNQLKRLDQIGEAFNTVDVVVLAGDLTNKAKVQDVEAILEKLATYSPQVLAVTGNWDSHEIDDYLDERGVGLHARHRVVDGIAFVGVGGSLPWIGGLQYEEEEFAALLKQAVADIDPALPLVLVSHQPPFGTLNSLTASNKDVGSQSIRAFIEEHQPLLCLTGHIHEGVGVDRIGKTQVVNPGMDAYAHVEITDGAVNSVKIIPVDTK